ncbi:hypothetical protein BD289DRAFT_271316 [Coniella lustricola]|uniref:Uncharacterized protein n=1 Tax=Coniella lustricola TaxID=2025994 RepID=A0A2T3AKF3_9PEZI|nr:hypothetical protein BD289DRAFT_271316 [Coniella lustricola]
MATMAEGPLTALHTTPALAMASEYPKNLTEEEKRQVEECQKILRFRDEILSGAHPRIKAPALRLGSKQDSEPRSPTSAFTAASSGPTVSLANAPKGPKALRGKASAHHVAPDRRAHPSNAQQYSAPATDATSIHPPGLAQPSKMPARFTETPVGPRLHTTVSHSDNASAAQFDPVLLTKSDDLIKAELQLQRQRLERALSDQVQQQRAAAKISNSEEALADFDLAEVLMKALQLVQASAPLQTDANGASNTSAGENESDGGNSTFYSSKHDTPESCLTHRILEDDDSDAIQQAREESHYEPPMIMEASPVPGPSSLRPSAQELSFDIHDPTKLTNLQSGDGATGRVTTVQKALGVPMEIISSQESGEASSSGDVRLTYGKQTVSHGRAGPVTGRNPGQAFGRRHSPILRAHNLSPVAPQPAHVSPLANSGQPLLASQDTAPPQATFAQVAALRNDRSNGSSPESSPQGRPSKKGRNKKKRKADRMAVNTTATSPYIKPEPRSPSPLTAPQYPRPLKRAKQATRPGYEHPLEEAHVQEVIEEPRAISYARYRNDMHTAYPGPLSHPPRKEEHSLTVAESPRYEQQYRNNFRPVETVRYVRRVSPGAQPYSYTRAVSRAPMDRSYDVRAPLRTIVRPVAEQTQTHSGSPMLIGDRHQSVMGPPRGPTSRVVVDEFGREYIDPSPRQESVIVRRSVAPQSAYEDHDDYYDPSRTTTRIVRRSVAPAVAYGEPEVVYERAPSRALSTMPGQDHYEEEVVYRSPGPAAGYTTTRRVVTRPEYAPEFRYYREREHPLQSVGRPGAECYELRATQEPRPLRAEPQREYIVRSATVHPEGSIRPQGMRISSVRPEPVPGEYGAPILLDDRLPPPQGYSMRPMAPPPPPPPQQPQYVRQWSEYEARPAYGEQDGRGEEEGVTYVENAPREMYR